MKKFVYLRQRLAEYGIDNTYLAEQLGRSESYVTKCLCGGSIWDMDEQYKIMDMVAEPYSRLYIMFPKNGLADKPGTILSEITVGEFLSALIRRGNT